MLVVARSIVQRTRVLFVAAALSGTCSCSGMQKPLIAIPDESGGPLANVILLPLTTRSTDGLLGHAWDTETDFADPLRSVLSGTVVVSGTEQHVMFFRDATAGAELDANVGIANAAVWASRITHVLYDVQITSLAAFATGTQRYNADSGCCLQGSPTESCTAGYVYRLMRGSGTIRLLQHVEGEIGVNAKELVMARGGSRYRVVDESTFNDAYFGLELSSLLSVCRTLTPDQEMAPLKLLASPNCTIHRYGALGERETLSRQLPSEELCLNVAKSYCGELPSGIACRVRFGTADEVDLLKQVSTPVEEVAAEKPAKSGKKSTTAPGTPSATGGGKSVTSPSTIPAK